MKTLKIFLSLLIIIFVSCENEINNLSKNIDVNGLNIEIFSSNVSDLTDVFFLNESVGYVVGEDGLIQKTIDAGKNWTSQESGTILNLTSVSFINENIGFAAGESSVLLKTTDGGLNWTKEFKSDINKFFDIHFFDENNGIAILMTMEFELSAATTNNGGDTWEYLNLEININWFLRIYKLEEMFVKNNTCYIIGDDQKLYKSNDYGDNWDTIQTPVQMERTSFVSNELVYISDYKTLYKTEDGGISWQNIPVNRTFILFHFFDDLIGFNIEYRSEYNGEGGISPYTTVATIIKVTSDGGENWTEKEISEVISGYTNYPTDKIGYCIKEGKVFVFRIN